MSVKSQAKDRLRKVVEAGNQPFKTDSGLVMPAKEAFVYQQVISGIAEEIWKRRVSGGLMMRKPARQ